MTRMTNHLTGQRVLERSVLAAVITPQEEGPPTLTARIRHELEGLDASGRILLEPYVNSLSMQFWMGTVGHPENLEGVPLVDFPDPNPVRLRLAVLKKDSPLLLAAADRVRPEIEGEDARARGILRTQTLPLGQRSWDLRLLEDGPLLEINERHAPASIWLRQAEVVGLVLPEVCRQALQWAAEQEDEGEPGDPVHDWLEFGRRLGLPERPPRDDGERVREWATKGASIFATSHRSLDRLPGLVEEEDA